MEPKSWPLDLGNFEYRSELGVKKSLNTGFCPEAKEQMKRLPVPVYSTCSETALSSLSLPTKTLAGS